MTHLSSNLPPQVEIGAQRHLDFGTEIIETDSGAEVRNNRWSTPRRTYDVSFPISERDVGGGETYYALVLALFQEAQGSLHSFNFKDWTDKATVPVRFDGPLTSQGLTPDLEHIVGVTLVEVKDEDTSP